MNDAFQNAPEILTLRIDLGNHHYSYPPLGNLVNPSGTIFLKKKTDGYECKTTLNNEAQKGAATIIDALEKAGVPCVVSKSDDQNGRILSIKVTADNIDALLDFPRDTDTEAKVNNTHQQKMDAYVEQLTGIFGHAKDDGIDYHNFRQIVEQAVAGFATTHPTSHAAELLKRRARESATAIGGIGTGAA